MMNSKFQKLSLREWILKENKTKNIPFYLVTLFLYILFKYTIYSHSHTHIQFKYDAVFHKVVENRKKFVKVNGRIIYGLITSIYQRSVYIDTSA